VSQRLRQRLIIQVIMSCLSVCMASDCDRLVDHPQLLRQVARPPLHSSQTRIKGFVEGVSPTVRGWVCMRGYPNQRLKRRLMVQVMMRQSNEIVGWAEPSVYRADVVKAYTDRCSSSDLHGFEITHLLDGQPLGPTTVKKVRFELFMMIAGPLGVGPDVPLPSRWTTNQTGCRVFGPVDFERNGGRFPKVRSAVTTEQLAIQTTQAMSSSAADDNCGIDWTDATTICYLQRYDDVSRVVCQIPTDSSTCSLNAARCHYANFGKSENRLFECSQHYVRGNRSAVNNVCYISITGSCAKYPVLTGREYFDDQHYGGLENPSPSSCEKRARWWRRGCGSDASVDHVFGPSNLTTTLACLWIRMPDARARASNASLLLLVSTRTHGAPCHGLRQSAIQSVLEALENEGPAYAQATLRRVGACDVEPSHTWTARTCAAISQSALPEPPAEPPRQQAHVVVRSRSAARRLVQRTLVSYAYYSPQGKESPVYAQCRSNLDAFLRWGLAPYGGPLPRVILNVIGDSPVPSLGDRHRITVRRREVAPADLFVHAQVLHETQYLNDTDYYVFLNCGVRGPYLAPESDATARLGAATWLEPFVSRLRNGVVLSGPSMSCELSAHLQSYFLVATKQAVEQFILPRWGIERASVPEDYGGIIRQFEVGLSTAIWDAGYKVESLQSWARGFEPGACAQRCQLNPTLFSMDPFELIFVKHGGATLSKQDPCQAHLLRAAESAMDRRAVGMSTVDMSSRTNFRACCSTRRYEPIIEYDEDDSAETITEGARQLLERAGAGTSPPTAARILVSYVYRDQPGVRANLEYFLSVALRDKEPAGTAILFALVINGWQCPVALKPHPGRRFIVFARRDSGFDYGGHGALLRKLGMDAIRPSTRLSFTHFIFMNSGVRGPFLPPWTPSSWHWTLAFTSLLGTKPPGSDRAVHLVGTSITCLSPMDKCVLLDPLCAGPKVEGFVTATDSAGIAILYNSTVFEEHATKEDAVIRGEYVLSLSMLKAGHNLASLQLAYTEVDWADRRNWDCNKHRFAARNSKYFGISMHPFETLFHKAHWRTGVPAAEADVLAHEMELYSSWAIRRPGAVSEQARANTSYL